MTDPVRGEGPRLEPLAPGEWDDFLARLVDAFGGPDHALNIFTTLGRHGELFQPWVRYGGALLAGRLAGRVREMAILRTSVNCDVEYEWVHHLDAAAAAGIGDEEIAALRRPLADGSWDEDNRVLLQAVDEMHGSWTLSDGTWRELHRRLEDTGTIELVMLVGQYHLVALALRCLGVRLEQP